MSYVLPIECIVPENRSLTGGKAAALAQLAQYGLPIPPGVCITIDAYRSYGISTGIRERIGLELRRKAFADMRWEEMWDCALRIRNMFLRTPMPASLTASLTAELEPLFAEVPVCVRSSSLAEDSSVASFAGLHESFVNIVGVESILEHIRLVWASLWSDAALLYRHELGLSIADSAMGVVVQRLVVGDASGVGFSEHPENRSAAVIEAVHGLNEGLVSGTIEPDRWVLDRASGVVLDHHQPNRTLKLQTMPSGVAQHPLSDTEKAHPPLDPERVNTVFRKMLHIEKLFSGPQDTEWTWSDSDFYILQSRPLTRRAEPGDGDERPWYLSLRGSLDSLVLLRERIEDELLPAITKAADECRAINPAALNDNQLADILEQRVELYQYWRSVYWDEFIPFAHGMRLFGQVYNDVVRPEDPYEFMDLLVDVPLLSIKRNQLLKRLGNILLEMQDADHLASAELTSQAEAMIKDSMAQFASVSEGEMTLKIDRESLCVLAIRLAQSRDCPQPSARATELECRFREQSRHLPGERVEKLLQVARASYRLRDDDNLYLGRIESAMLDCARLAKARLAKNDGMDSADGLKPRQLVDALRGQPVRREATPRTENMPQETSFVQHSRQLSGQPAGSGLASGTARVIRNHEDLLSFVEGEILICDAIQPHMTIVAPLAKAVVERRGGMLIHGAIIAREYGLPCVTGVTELTSRVKTGQYLTVDGYLGIVVNHGLPGHDVVSEGG